MMPRKAISKAVDAELLLELFDAQCRRNGTRTAIECGKQAWTYRELHEKSNFLARLLLRDGLEAGKPVLVAAERSFELVAALLAVMRAGGVFVPVDPSLPKERLRAIATHLAADLWLGSETAFARLPETGARRVLVTAQDAASQTPVAFPRVNPESCAYIIYTSGTTGEPKGVMISHANLASYLTWAGQTYFGDPQASGALVHTSISFDLTFTALFTPLTLGQPLVLVPEDSPAQGVVDLLGVLRSGRRLALLKLTPSHLASLAQLAPQPPANMAVATVVIGGEALSAKVAAWAQASFANATLFNEYGPTETTVGCTCYRLEAGAQFPDYVPIGKPLPQAYCYVLNAERNLVPTGVAGELFIGGDGVGLGYYRSPELTETAFIADPFNPARRLYRSGDRVRELADGNLEFLDRLDRQIKVRGYRVELLEIESLLARLPEVEQAVVVDIRNPADTSVQLVAFVKLTPGTPTESIAGTLSQYLADRLPPAAVPSRFCVVDAFALTANGKVDYTALRASAAVVDRERPATNAPAGEAEEVLAQIWKTVLGVEQVDVLDNYFALGGDSIRSIRIASEAQRHGLDVSVADIHKHTSIRKLAEAIRDKLTINVRPVGSGAFSLISAEDRARLPEGIEDAYPLNLLQEGMIYHRAFSPKSAVYHAMLGLHIRGKFDLALMRRALQELVDRHPVMRTEFDLTSYSRPLQLVHRDVPVPMEFVDLRELSPDQHRIAIEAWMGEEKRRGFEFNTVPLIRFAVHQFAADRFHLIFSYHHEIIDGWSEATMTSQLLDHYFSMIHGNDVVMKKPQSTFRDSIVLERQALESDSHKTYWTQYLKGTTLIRLPRLLSGPKADKGEREIIKKPVIINAALSEQLLGLARELHVPISTVLLCAHMFVLRQYSSYQDVLTHMVSNGRPEDNDGQNTLGLFVNSFTFRLRFGSGTWASAIAATLEEEQRSIAYRRYPMAELKRHQGSEPLAETLFFFTNYHVYHILDKWDDAELIDINLYGESTFPFCAICKLNPFSRRLQMRIEYDLLQFAPDLINSMADCYIRVLAAMVADPHASFNNRSLLSPQETTRIVDGWGRRPLSGPADEPVHEVIARLARQAPDRPALVYKSDQVTYAALNGRANQLARLLLARGLRIEDTVGICVGGPVETIVAMLAVLKAGGCYVPLGAEYSDERSLGIVAESGARCVIVDATTRDKYASFTGMTLAIDGEQRELSAHSAEDLEPRVDPANAAYSIYTSGSTGKPKGVVISHANLSHSTAARREYYGDSRDRAILVSPFCFDSSVATIYGTLTSGGTLILFRDATRFDLAQLETTIRDQRVSSMLCIPNLYGSLLDSCSPGSLTSLQRVIVAGEICPRELYDQHRKHLPQVGFFNEYGPTEAAVWSTVWKSGSSKILTQIPIGGTIPGAEVHILNHELLPVPVGVQGEIHIGGSGIARGYAGDAQATAENFIPNPFASGPGERLYRTRDLGRRLLDGNIEFLGRMDNQVKIQGYRVEIGEVEAVLNACPQVKRSIVHAEADRDGQKMLVAYIVPRQPEETLEVDIRRYVRDKLPKYMHPRSYVMLSTLPVTESGKIDYDTLPKGGSEPRAPQEIARPRDSVEECIVGIWSQVLGNSNIGIHDGFLDMGGESLRAMQIVSRVRKVFDVTIPMENLVTHGATIAELSSYVKHNSGVGSQTWEQRAVAGASH